MAKIAAAYTIHDVMREAMRAREENHGKVYLRPHANEILDRIEDGPWPRGKRKSRKLMDLIEEEMVAYEEATGQWALG